VSAARGCAAPGRALLTSSHEARQIEWLDSNAIRGQRLSGGEPFCEGRHYISPIKYENADGSLVMTHACADACVDRSE
jgi:hypothetical protein